MIDDRNEFLRCGRRFSAAAAGTNVQAALLGKSPTYAPDRPFDSLHVKLDLAVDFARKALAGTCETRVRARRPGVRLLEFNAVGLKVSKAFIDGKCARVRQVGDTLRISADHDLNEVRETVVLVQYQVQSPAAGLHFVSRPRQLWSQSQPEDARRWFPCQDSPHSKVTSEVRVRVPVGMTGISNGTLVDRTATERGTVWHWRMDRPHSIYLITLVAGHFTEIEEDWEGTPVIYYCEPGREADARRGFAKTKKALQFFSEKTGVRYPYSRYAQVAVAEYPGGMEHTTCTTQTDACLIDSRASLDHDLDLLVAHELAHQWFGDLVTCAEWPHAWLNEGFATYFEILFQEYDKGTDEAQHEMQGNARVYFHEDSRRYRRPIVCRTYGDPWTIFDRHLYEKGAWVLHMLRHDLGEQLWWKAIGHYLRKHQDSLVRTSDLIVAIEEATGRNVQGFFDQWIHRPGHPVLRARWTFDVNRRRGSMWLIQTQEVTTERPAFRFKIHVRVTGRDWVRDFREDVTSKEHRFHWKLPGAPLNVEFDPDLFLLKAISLAKPVPMWFHQLSKGSSAASRSLAAEHVARWGGVEGALALEKQILREPFWGAATEMIHALGGIAGEVVDKALIRQLRAVRHPKSLRAIVSELGRRGARGCEQMILRLARNHPALGVQAEATRALGRYTGARPRTLLRKALMSRSYRDILAASAVSALAVSRKPQASRTLRFLAAPPRPYGVRVAAIRALGDFATYDPELIPWLCARISDPDERVTMTTIAALGAAEDERAITALEALSKKSGNSRIRVTALEALSRIRAGGKKASV